MWILSFYRFYLSCAAGILFYFFVKNIWWAAALSSVGVRIIWALIEYGIASLTVNRLFKRHIQSFKNEFGPYGIRVANNAEKDRRTRKSLCEVFEPDMKKLKKTVEQLEVMDALFKAGMSPEADEFLLHDLKLKYGKLRLEKNTA